MNRRRKDRAMISWLKKNSSIIITVFVSIALIIYLYGCEPKTRSLVRNGETVNRQELQLELKQLIALAQIRMLDLDKQEQLRAIVFQNALILMQGQPLNPVGIISGVLAIYGVTQGGCKITKVVKNIAIKRKVNNGTT